jgi:glycosyltransferase involved in cell wall biosynthesis
VTVIGGVPIDGSTSYRPSPSITWVMDLLRSSAVHVVAGHADPCGTLGAMALAAGSALVTTDTPGAGEHVVAGRTAVVVPVGDADAMAAGVLALLEDAELRTQMAAAGQSYVRALFPSWREAARRVAVIIHASR